MEKFKVTCIEDNEIFVETNAFTRLLKEFRKLKTKKGKIINIVGSPGTGKSANIYHALNVLDLHIYDVELKLDSTDIGPFEIFQEFINTLKRDFKVKTKDDAYRRLSQFDMVLFADKILDSDYSSENKIALTQWLQKNRLKSILLYLRILYELLKYRTKLQRVNLIFHMTLTFEFGEKKYDVLSDFSLFSMLIKGILKLFFDVIEIKYDESETIEIINSHFQGVSKSQIRSYIKKYGYRPRYILQAIEQNLMTDEKFKSNIKLIEPTCKLKN